MYGHDFWKFKFKYYNHNILVLKAIADYKCNVCEKLELKNNKQKEKYENRIKQLEENEKSLREDISKLTKQVREAVTTQVSVESLEKERSELQSQLNEHEKYVLK